MGHDDGAGLLHDGEDHGADEGASDLGGHAAEGAEVTGELQEHLGVVRGAVAYRIYVAIDLYGKVG